MIWKRYFLHEISKIFSLFLVCFYLLFVIMDASSHLQDFVRESHLQLSKALLYYLSQFSKHAHLIVPLALLVSTIKVLTSFNASRELTALQASGIKVKTLLTPFFLTAALLSLLLLLNFEFLSPKAESYMTQFYQDHFKHSYHGNRKEPIHVLQLKDNTKLVYQTTSASGEIFIDVLWVQSFNDIWRMKYLKAAHKNPEAFFVDHLKRNSQGELEKSESFDRLVMQQIAWNPETAKVGKAPVEDRKISHLLSYLTKSKEQSPYTTAEITSHLLFKFLVSLLPLLTVIAASPFCVRYTRELPLFFTYSLALFAYIAFYSLLDSSLILGETGVISPFVALVAPFSLVTLFFSWKYAKTE